MTIEAVNLPFKITNQIKLFFVSHPSIDKSKFSRECGMHVKTIDLVLNKGREIPKKHMEKVIERMAHYGNR
jgi:hypothetical protein